jgi:hypothetical protein
VLVRAIIVIGVLLFVAWLIGGLLRSRTGR